MKRISLYILALAAGVLAACKGDYDDWAAPQGYDQEELAAAIDLTLAEAPAIDMATVEAEVLPVFIPTVSLPEGYSLTGYKVTVDYPETHSNSALELTVASDGTAAVADIVSCVESLYGRAPFERELVINVIASISDGTRTYLKKAEPVKLNVTLVAPYISNQYWIVGAPSQWDVMCVELPFSHSDVNVYVDPIFTVTFPVSAGDTWLAIADEKTHESGDWSALLGCAEGNGQNGTEGFIARRSDLTDDGSWMIHADQDCTVRMTINMMDYSYKIDLLLFQPYVYLPGSSNDWGFAKDILLGNNEGQYEGFAVLGGEWGWKVSQYPDWDHGDYGYGGDGCIAAGGGNIMEGTEAKPYYVKIDLAGMTYELTEITSWSIIGSVKGSWDTDVDMTADLANRCWTVTADLNAGEFKFRANHDWGINLGGTYDSMVGDGANLQLSEDGSYTITLYPSYNGASSCTVVKN